MPIAKESRIILITGAGRGLGLGFARRWLDAGNRVFALARDPGNASGLRDLAKTHGDSLIPITGDVADESSIRRARTAVEEQTDRLDLLLNNAGIYGSRDETLDSLNPEDLHRVFEVNAIGPIRMAREFLPLLLRGNRPRIINMTSLMGSLEDNSSGGSWAYRLSKAALNMANRNLALELAPRGILSVVLHPGWVRTDMGGSHAPLALEDSVAEMVATIDRLTDEKSGRFIDRKGEELPW